MNIRDAAQALVDVADLTGVGSASPEVTALRAALALPDAPPKPGWAEGWRAGREDAARLAKGWNAAGYPIGCAIEQMPAPSAPTQAPEAKTVESETFWCVRAGKNTRDLPHPWHRDCASARREGETLPGPIWEIVRVTVEPAPVEPEETP